MYRNKVTELTEAKVCGNMYVKKMLNKIDIN